MCRNRSSAAVRRDFRLAGTTSKKNRCFHPFYVSLSIFLSLFLLVFRFASLQHCALCCFVSFFFTFSFVRISRACGLPEEQGLQHLWRRVCSMASNVCTPTFLHVYGVSLLRREPAAGVGSGTMDTCGIIKTVAPFHLPYIKLHGPRIKVDFTTSRPLSFFFFFLLSFLRCEFL